MIIKSKEIPKSLLSVFDIIGDNEIALSKSFAYLLSIEKECFGRFLKFLGVKHVTKQQYKRTEIGIEIKHEYGRTDIEIHFGDAHIIIETKIKGGRVTGQRTQYFPAFAPNATKKIICFITNERDSNILIPETIQVRFLTWRDIINLFEERPLIENRNVMQFIAYLNRRIGMSENKEILIQDLKEAQEIQRYKEHYVYRRDETYGNALYFAPYFTRQSRETEGITSISKILGILTIIPTDIESYSDDLHRFTKNNRLIEKWKAGIGENADDNKHTFYLLDEPFPFKMPLRKDTGIQKGRGKDWIACYIPKNRRVGFIDLLKHIPELKQEQKV